MRLLIALPLLALAACGPLVQIGSNEAPPHALLRLSASTEPQAPAPANRPTVRIVLPIVPAELRTLRIPVETQATQLQFLAQGQWVEPPAQPLQRLLLTRIAQRTGWLMIDERSADVAADQRLSGRLSAFGLDARQHKPRAHLRYEALLTGSNITPRAHSFEIHVPVAQQSAEATAAALNQASHILADQLIAWLRDGTLPAKEQAIAENH